MNDRERPVGRPALDEEQLRRWLGEAGARPRPDAERTRRVHQAVRGAWRQTVEARRRRRRRAGLALAAAVLLAAVIGSVGVPWLWNRRDAVAMAHVVRVAGLVQRLPADGHGTSEDLVEGAVLRAGDTLETATGGAVAVAYGDGATLRIAPRSRIVFDGPAAVRLEQGRAYADSGRSAGGTRFSIRTSRGAVEDIGTRFLVRATQDELGVWVRDGRVRVRAPAAGGDLLVGAGRFVEIPARGEPRHGTVGAADPIWEWTEQVAPPFELEGSSFEQLIVWVSRETGFTVQWADEDVRSLARATMMHGSLDGLAPRQALEVVPATGFQVRLENDAIRVDRAGRVD